MFETDDGLVFQGFRPRDVIGKYIVAECGEKHLVEQISYSHKYADMMILNEHDESMPTNHYWVHVLSLARQMMGMPIPTKEEKEAASRVFHAVRWEPTDGDHDKGGPTLVTPSGLKLVKK